MADLVHCYNKGCGQKFDPTNNQEGKKKYRNQTWRKNGGGGLQVITCSKNIHSHNF